MLGFRGQENCEFESFFQIIQRAASVAGMVFFADAGEGDVIRHGEYECETMNGWLIPLEKADEFSPAWRVYKVDDNLWGDQFCFAEYKINAAGEISIFFNDGFGKSMI